MEKTIKVVDMNGVQVMNTIGTKLKATELATCFMSDTIEYFGDMIQIKLRVAM